MKKAGSAILTGIFYILFVGVHGQNPTHYPSTEHDPVHFNAVNIIVFIIIPIAIVVGFYLIRRNNRKKVNKER
ncbi:MAG: hypothetical protein KQI35_02165 [Bacteroidetes bacterium]|nr:hypothetical protein [Bacteroidota bacterium]